MTKDICVNNGKATKIKGYEFSQEEHHIRIYGDKPIDIIFNPTPVLMDACIVKVELGNGVKTAKIALPLCDYGEDTALEEIIKDALRFQ